MALDGGYYGSFEHAMANLAIGRRQGEEDGYKKGFSEGYNKALQEANQRIAELQAQYQAALDHEVVMGNMKIAFMAPAIHVLGSLMRSPNELGQHIRSTFRDHYVANVRESLNKELIPVAPELSTEFAQEMPRTRQFLLEVLQP